MSLKQNKDKIYICLSFIGILVLCYLFPYALDDWAWGTNIGIERLQSWFLDYNGRYAGNILVIILTRSNILKSMFLAFTIIGIAYGACSFINKDSKVTYWIILIFICVMPVSVFAQSIAWTSGFTNYTVPVFGIIIYFNMFKNVFEEEYIFNKKLLIPAILLGFINALFMENITIYNVFISVVLLAYTKIKHKKMDVVQLAFLMGATMGLICMFTNGAYSNIAAGEDFYREVPTNGNIIVNAIKLYFNEVYLMFIMDNKWINIILGSALMVYSKKDLSNIKNMLIKRFYIAITYFFRCFTVYSILKMFYAEVRFFGRYTKYVEGLFAIVFCLATLCVTLLGISENVLKKKAFLIEISIVVITAPLFFVNPISPRCFLPGYILFAMLTGVYLECVLPKNKNICKFLLIVFMVGLAPLVVIYANISKVNKERITYVKQEVEEGEKIIEVPNIPYEEYVWMTKPVSKMWKDRFLNFYGVYDDVEVVWKK